MPEFKLPDVGEGLTEAEIVAWRVKVGDTVAVNDVVVEIETAKSIVELPSPYAGEVTALLAKEGDEVTVGTPIIVIGEAVAPKQAEPVATPDPVDEELATSRAMPGEVPDPVALAPEPAAEIDTNVPPEGQATLVGYGPRQRELRRRPRHRQGPDLAAPAAPRRRGAGPAETREPVKGVRKQMAAAMTASAFTAPHVTEWVTVDVTRTVELVRRLRDRPELAETKVSPLLVAAKAVLLAIARNPLLNSQYDDEAQEVVVKRRVNLGIAAATARGLIVPNIKDAQDLSLVDLATALNDLTATAREGRTPPADQAGGTFTITNVGVFGVDGGTPIINPGESAILCLGAVRRQPWVDADTGEVVARDAMTLAVSFDHRHIDGATGSRFLADVAGILADPGMAMMF
ncbi:MAG: 2-oxo acid dehydrogenase subunit E2 [Nocardioidaceae bacterium]|nr:2-oxo acid dehydrogenase subunit E2 [Nocardioidaceae bacterium]MCL2612951.1 2-oxo acid dehydrogenase subunit E2 [Nocardioidaceae bacterium]